MKKLTSKLLASMLSLMFIFAMSLTPVHAGTKIDSAVNWAVSIANNDKYGYDQQYRWGPNYDCSSLIISAYKQAGVNTGGATYTGDMRQNFLNNGFYEVKSSVNLRTGSGLQKGDVLIKTKHTVMVSAVNGSRVTIVHASGNEWGGATGGKSGDQTGKEILTQNYYYDSWYTVLRYKEGNTTNPNPNPNPPGNYYPRYTGSSGSIVDALNAVRADSSYSNRTKIAAANGISNYSGTAAQNTQMLNLLKQGRLVKPGSGSNTNPSVTYFPRYTGSSGSIVNALNAVGADSSYSYRSKIAAKNNIANYSGTAAQNTQMLSLLKQGKLIKP